MIFTDDPIRDYNSYSHQEDIRYRNAVKNAPICEFCGETLMDYEYAYDMGAFFVCQDCIESDEIKVSTERWME